MSVEAATAGAYIPPISRVRLFSPEEWEFFILEWVDSIRSDYGDVHRCGGGGDQGRDVIAISNVDPAVWDNFQCKHYNKALSVGDVRIEVAKVLYYTHLAAYTTPRRSFFVAPLDCSTPASNLLLNPAKLKQSVLDNWDTSIRDKITSTGPIALEGALKTWVEGFDFAIFGSKPVPAAIREHSKTRWHIYRFGGGLPERAAAQPPPSTPGPQETAYVRALLDAYEEHLGVPLAHPGEVAELDLSEHFTEARVEFYCAEALRVFSRDALPPGEFERLQNDVYSGISHVLRKPSPSGYIRCLDTVGAAKQLPLTHHPLHARTAPADRGGICHQLANDGRVKWRRV